MSREPTASLPAASRWTRDPLLIGCNHIGNWQSCVGQTQFDQISKSVNCSSIFLHISKFARISHFYIIRYSRSSHLECCLDPPKLSYVAGWWDYFIAGIAAFLYPADAKILQMLHRATAMGSGLLPDCCLGGAKWIIALLAKHYLKKLKNYT